MKNLIIVGVILGALLPAAQDTMKPQMCRIGLGDSIRMVIDSSISLLRTHALHRNGPDWEALRAETYALAGNAGRLEDLGPAAAHLFEAVDDHHGWLAIGDSMLRWPRRELPYLNDAIKKEFAKGNRIVRKLLPDGVGYLRVPGMFVDTSAYNRMAQSLADSLLALAAEGAVKFIIDLRLNAGGTMFPMIAGLSPLLGDGSFLGDADAQGKILNMSRLEKGCFTGADGGAASVNVVAAGLRRAPVVVLTGHGTGSAGECVAIAFKGRSHTWFIGEPTAGFTTGNNGHWIVDGRVGIVIAETVAADRNRKVYRSALIPDEWVPGGDDFRNQGSDRKIAAALKRLEKK